MGKAESMPLTNGWQWRKLGDCVRLINGRAYSQHELLDSGTPVIRIQNLNGGDRWYYSDLNLPEDKYCQKGDLLFAWSASFGPYIWEGEKSIFHYHIWRVIPNDLLDKAFAFRLLEWLTDRVRSASHGVAMLHMTKAGMEAWDIPLPPIAEQVRIAAILDQADALRVKRREAIAQLDILTQSIFIEMFGDPVANSKGWDTGKLGEHTLKMGSGSTPTGGDAAYKESGISLIRSLNVHDGKFLYKNLAFIDEQQASKLANVKVIEGDVLLNITGASVARVCRAPKDVLPARVNQHVMIIRPKPTIDGTFLERMLLSREMKKNLLRIGGAGATREAITKAQAEELTVICPPIPLQQSFAKCIESIDKIRSSQLKSLAELDALFSSLQYRAFGGEL